MQNDFQTAGNTLTPEEIESLNRLKTFVSQGESRMNAVKILSDNHNDIVNQALSTYRSEIFLRCICYISLLYIQYALFLKDKKPLEQVQAELNLLKDMYFSLGGTNSLLVDSFRQMQAFITPLVNDLDIVAELDSYFEYVIFSLVNQGHDAILKKQHKGLARLRQEWLDEDPEDPNEQQETWNYLRDALNNGTLSHRPIPA